MPDATDQDHHPHPPKPFPKPFLALCLLVILASTAAPQVVVAAEDLDVCRRVALSEDLSWISSVVWLGGDQSEILVTNPKIRQTLVYSPEGEMKGVFSPGDEAKGGEEAPRAFAVLPVTNPETGRQEQLLITGDDKFVWAQRGEIDLRSDAPESGYTIDTQFQRTIASGNHLFGYGTLKKRDSEVPIYGFFARRLTPPGVEAPGVTELVAQLEKGELYYRIGNQYVVSMGSRVFFLVLENTVKLYSYDTASDSPVAQELRGFPGEDLALPSFTTELYGFGFSDIYDAIEGFFGLPSGLYAQDGLLYALFRPSHAEGFWRMIQMRAGEDRVEVLGELVIPSHAPHLQVLPTPRFWIFFERGPVGEGGYQQTKTMLRIPKRWMKNSVVSPLYLPGAEKVLSCAGVSESYD